MRISTNSMFRTPLESIIRQQAETERTQQEISTGVKKSALDKDPSAGRRVSDLERKLADGEQFAANTSAVTSRLGTVENSLESAINLLQRVRELTVMSLTGSLGTGQRTAVATEVRALNEQLLAIANRRNASGEYIFAGTRSDAAPFSGTGASIAYNGGTSEREIRIDDSTVVKDGFTGLRTFMEVPRGNGYFSTSAASTNAGTAVADGGVITNATSWNGSTGDFRIVFTVSGNTRTYEVQTDSGAALNPPVTGSYQSGQAITFLGAQVTVQGDPANGDTFSIVRSSGSNQYQSVFATIDRQLNVLETPVTTAVKAAQQTTDLGNILQQIDQALSNLGSVRSESGARLRVVEQSEEFREDEKLDVQETLSELRDVDLAEALGRLNAQMTALQVAQQAYARIASRSLFDYL